MESLEFSTVIHFTLRGPNGAIKDEWQTSNFMTEAGEAFVADQLAATSDLSAMSHMAVGTGTGQTVASTTLANETARVAFETGYPAQGTAANDNRVEFYAIFPAGTGTGTITEFAVFNAATNGTMLNYATGFAKLKAAGDSLDIHCYLRCGVT